jgi:hypothetical protein
VNSRFEQLLHGDSSQLTSSFSLHREVQGFRVARLQSFKVHESNVRRVFFETLKPVKR